MINDCLAGKIDYIITKSVSRFARNTVDCLDYVRMLKSKGIGVYFEEQQIDTLKTDSELYLVIYAGFAQSESESISKNITWSVRKKFEEGTPVFIYKRFLGYKRVLTVSLRSYRVKRPSWNVSSISIWLEKPWTIFPR